MKNLKMLMASSFVAIVVLSAPFVTFAKDSGKYKGDDNKVKVSQSFFTRVFGGLDHWFGTDVEASVDASLTPNISGITAPTVLSVGQTGTWKVKASDPEDGSLSYVVDWGDTSSSEGAAKSLNSSAFVQTSTFTHAYANPGTYNITFTVSNEDGLKATSSVSVRVKNSNGQQAPVISNFSAVSKYPRHATLKWTTDVKSTSLVWFGTSSPVDTSDNPDVLRKGKIKNHVINLQKLTPDTKYYVIVGSANGSGTTKSSEISFTTPKLPNQNGAPVITSLYGPSKTIKVGDTATVKVNAYDPENGALSYSADWGDNMSADAMALRNMSRSFVQTTTFTHVYSEVGTYTASFSVEDEEGKTASKSVKITVIDED